MAGQALAGMNASLLARACSMVAVHMRRYRISLDIPASGLLEYYRGNVQSVSVTSREGFRIRFPVAALRPYVTRDGVHGEFILICDDHYRLFNLEKVTC